MKGKEAGLFLAQQQANQNTDFFNNMRTFPTLVFGHAADAAFLCLGCKPFVSKLRKPPKRSSKLVISRQDQTALL